MNISFEEKQIIEKLDKVLKDKSILEIIDSTAKTAKEELIQENVIAITKTVPFEIFKNKLPQGLGLCRVYILRANTEAKVEKHTNSIQRVMSYKGSGNIKVLDNDTWQDNLLNSIKSTDTKSRWLTVKEDTWHQPIALDENWITITFHTASEGQIIDVYKD